MSAVPETAQIVACEPAFVKNKAPRPQPFKRLRNRCNVHASLVARKVAIALAILVGAVFAVRFCAADGNSASAYNLGIDTGLYDTLAQHLAAGRDLAIIPPRQP